MKLSLFNKKISLRSVLYILMTGIELCLLLLCMRSSSGCLTEPNSRLVAAAGQPSQGITAFKGNEDLAISTPLPSPEPTPSPVPTPEPSSSPTPIPTPSPMPIPAENTHKGGSDAVQKEKLQYPIIWGNKSKIAVYLTFDDGYDANALIKTLEVLKKKDIKCTFFIVGDALRKYPDLFKQAIAEGHQICNHTDKHLYFTESVSDNEVKREIEGWERSARDILGEEYLVKMKKEFPYIRLPGGYGHSSGRVLKIVADAGYIPIGWSDETIYSVLRHFNLNRDPVDPIAEKVANHVISNCTNGSIILLHFNAFDTGKLEEMIQGIQENGFVLKLISNIFNDNSP